MLNIGKLISDLLVSNNMTAVDLAKELGFKKQSVYAILKKTNIDTALLERIAEILKVPITYFFGDDTASLNQKLAEVTKENERLQNELKKDDEIIELYKKHLQVIENDLEHKLKIAGSTSLALFKIMEEYEKGNIKFNTDKDLSRFIQKIKKEVKELEKIKKA